MGFTRSVPVEVECGAVGSFELGVFKQTFAYRDRIGTRGKEELKMDLQKCNNWLVFQDVGL